RGGRTIWSRVHRIHGLATRAAARVCLVGERCARGRRADATFRLRQGCYSEIVLNLKPLLKRGALLTAANWPSVAIQFAAETTFQVLLAVPVVGAAVLVAVLLGGDLANLLQGSTREIITTVANALTS